jgi:hypothetical protein
LTQENIELLRESENYLLLNQMTVITSSGSIKYNYLFRGQIGNFPACNAMHSVVIGKAPYIEFVQVVPDRGIAVCFFDTVGWIPSVRSLSEILWIFLLHMWYVIFVEINS